jgi:hypothetical protein
MSQFAKKQPKTKLMLFRNNSIRARVFILASIVLFSTPNSPRAQVVDPTIIMDLPDYVMQPNSSATFDLFVQNTGSARGSVNGIGVYLETAASGPTITAVDVLTDTIFGAVSNNGQNGAGTGNNGFPRFFYQETSTSGGGTVSIANGTTKFASATFDSTGVAPGQYTYTLDTGFGATFYTTTGADINPTLFSGTLTVVPEPTAAAVAAGIFCTGAAALVRLVSNRTKKS